LKDLLEYLLQLLGDSTPEVIEFVDNVGRFQKGEPIVMAGSEIKTEIEDSKPPPKETSVPLTPLKKQSKSDALKARRNQKQNKSRVPPPQKKGQESKQSEPIKKPEPRIPPQSAELKEETVAKSRPPKGKAKIICGCFGTKHKPLTNCLYCGRISCVKEGYDFCGFCGYLMEEIRDGV
jgi:hypothetical protein